MTTETHTVKLPPKPVSRLAWVLGPATAAVIVWSVIDLDAKWDRLPSAPADIYRLCELMASKMEWGDVGKLTSAMWESISIAWLGTIIAAVFAVPLSFLAAENLVGRPIAWATRQVLNILRAVPEIILALAFIPLFGLTPMAGVMAIGVGSIGTLGKLFYEIIEGIQSGPIEASDAVGATRPQRLRWGVFPQVTPEISSFILYRFEINIRASAVMGLVGAGGIGSDISQALRFKDYGVAGLGLIIVIIGTIVVDTISGAVRRRIVAGPRTSDETEDVLPMAPSALAPGIEARP